MHKKQVLGGAIMTIIASVLFMLHIIDLSELYLSLNTPKALQELVLAVWLIIKGFNPKALEIIENEVTVE